MPSVRGVPPVGSARRSIQMTDSMPGVSGLSLYVPELRISLEDWSEWTGNDWNKIQNVVGRSFRMPRPDENVYTMAANAVLDLILKYEVDPQRVGFLSLGTESSTDNSAGSVIVRGMVDTGLRALGMPRLSVHCEVQEVKHACIGGVYAMKNAARYLALDGRERAAIVVACDIAEYARGSTGEQTQGCGAVAMLLEAEPRIFSIDLRRTGSSSNYRGPDFRKPVHRFFMGGYRSAAETERHHDFPIFNGRYSTVVYIDSTLRAMRDLYEKQGELRSRREFLSDSVSSIFFHRPYHWMPVQALGVLWVDALAHDGDPDLDEICAAAEVSPQTLREELAMESHLFSGDDVATFANTDPTPTLSAVSRAARKSQGFQQLLANNMSLGADRAKQMGNLYTAALPAWLAAGFEQAAEERRDLTDKTLLAIGYGSGDASEAMILKVVPGWEEAARKVGFLRSLEQHLTLNRDAYEHLHDKGHLPADFGVTRPEETRAHFIIDHLGQQDEPKFQDLGVEYYRWVG
jgi:hydroxymethylglutaryl-CoA synthase